MEFVATKRRKKWKKKRYLRKRKRSYEQIKVEVKSTKHWEIFPERINTFDEREIGTSTMQADAFWKNYAIAQEWQKRHNITWWRSRCLALEYENEMLRNKLKLLAQHRTYPNTVTQENNHYYDENNDEETQEENNTGYKDNEDVELNVTEDMLKFLETSERHRRQLKQKYKSKKIVHEMEDLVENNIIDDAESVRTRKEDANLLYGNHSSKILAIETALQTATNKYKKTYNPQYWPNIPLKP